MKVIEIKGKKYNLKFGYRSLYKTGILKKLQGAQDIFSKKSKDGPFEKVEKLMDVTAEAFLIGLQKYHKEEFGYTTDEEKDYMIDKVCDLFDDMEENDDELGILEIFAMINDELVEQGFLGKLVKTQEILNQQEMKVIPETPKS